MTTKEKRAWIVAAVLTCIIIAILLMACGETMYETNVKATTAVEVAGIEATAVSRDEGGFTCTVDLHVETDWISGENVTGTITCK